MTTTTTATVPSTFQRSLPVTLTSFINRAGTIGMSIIPVLLVERGIPVGQSAWVMGVITSASFVGITLGGLSSDRLGLRRTLLLSFAVSGVGLALLPFSRDAALIAGWGFIAQLGASLYYGSARLLLTQLVGPGERREAIAWQRTGNNFAQVISYSLGAVLGSLGTRALFLFDAFTSFLAVGVGARLLPETRARGKDAGDVLPGSGTLGRFLHGALIIAAFALLYDLYMVAAAARCRILFGAAGLTVFSEVMIINTVLCGFFAVVAARHLENAARALPAGILLTAVALAVTFGGSESRAVFFVGSLLLTLGEIVFNSVAGLVLIQITPAGKRPGTLYSNGILVQFLGRVAGSAAAFPLVVAAPRPLAFIGAAGVTGLALCWGARSWLADPDGSKSGPRTA